MTNRNLRKPNQKELRELADYILSGMGSKRDTASDDEIKQADDLAAGAYTAVFDKYVTDSPGYAGKLMSVVWSAGPALYEVFIWRDGKMVRVDQEL